MILLLTGYAFFLGRYISPHAGGSDTSGYLNSARLLARAEFLVPARTLPGHPATAFGEKVFQPLGFSLQKGGGWMAPTYPIGLPLHLVAASWLVGWPHAVALVNLTTILACSGLMWALARRLSLPPAGAAGAVILLLLCPLFLFSAVQPMSDLLAVAWSLATLYCALRARDHWRWGLAGGVALGVAVLVRPTNALLVVPLLVALGRTVRAYLPFTLGALPGAACFAFYNWRVYGSPVVTGYGDVSADFSRDFLPHNLMHFARWIPVLLSPLILLALAAPFLPALRQRDYAVLAAWFAVLTGFYALYYHAGETWWYLRFILPVFPALILAALAVLAAAIRAARLRPAVAAVVTAVLVAGAGGWEARQIRQLDVLTFEPSERSYSDAARWAQKNLPARSVIFCMQVSGAFYYYTDFLLFRWEQVDADKAGALFAAAAQQDRPVYAALFPFETPAALERIGGHWTRLTTTGQVTFWQRQP
jgi:hypothetical protein